MQLKGLVFLLSSIFLSPQSQNSRRWAPGGLHGTDLNAAGLCCHHWLGSRSLARSGAGSSLDTQMGPGKLDWGRPGPGGNCGLLSSDLDVSFIVKGKCKRVKEKVFTWLWPEARKLQTDGQGGKKGLFGQGLPNSSMTSWSYIELIAENMRWEKRKAQMIKKWMNSEEHSPSWWWRAVGEDGHWWFENEFGIPEYCKNQHEDQHWWVCTEQRSRWLYPNNVPTIPGSHHLGLTIETEQTAECYYRCG